MTKTTPIQFADEMKKIAEMQDRKIAHAYADEVMCRVLTELGYWYGVKHFKEMERSYK